MRRKAGPFPMAVASNEHADSDSVPTAESPLVIVVTRSTSTRMQLVRNLPAEAVLLLAPDRTAVERALQTDASRMAIEAVERPTITCGGLVFDPMRQRVTWLGIPLRLTRLERRLLACLIEPPLRVWPYELLYRTVWGQVWLGDTSTLHAIVKRLRRRLRDGGVTVVVESIRGVGFGLVVQPAEVAGPYHPERAESVAAAIRPHHIAPAADPIRSHHAGPVAGSAKPGHPLSESAARAAATPSWKRVATP
jgi:two-component system, OmpR family, response regulator MtrA